MVVQVWSARRWRRGLLALGLLVCGVALLRWPQAVASGVSRGLSLCGGVVIPSLFVFMVLSGLWVRSGVADAMGRRLDRPMRALYRLPGCAASALLISLVGGYPAGAAAVRELLDSGALTESQARRLLRGCVNAGPAFIIGGIGAGMLGNPLLGAVLFGAHLLASLITGLLCCRARKGEEVTTPPRHAATPTAQALVESVSAACRSMLQLCGFVILSAGVLSLLDAAGVTRALTDALMWLPMKLGLMLPITGLVSGLLEVSCGCIEAASAGEGAPWLLGVILGWGGLSVHGQVAALTAGHRLVDRRFFLARGVQAVLGGVISELFCRFLPVSHPALAAGNGSPVQWYTTSVTATVALLLLCGLWLLSLPARRKEG